MVLDAPVPFWSAAGGFAEILGLAALLVWLYAVLHGRWRRRTFCVFCGAPPGFLAPTQFDRSICPKSLKMGQDRWIDLSPRPPGPMHEWYKPKVHGQRERPAGSHREVP